MVERLRGVLHKKIILSLLLSVFAFQLISGMIVPRFKEAERSVYIEATGEQNINSKSNGVQIKDILVNGKQHISPSDLFELSSWIHEDSGALTWNAFENRNSIVSTNIRFKSLRIELAREEYSGIAKVYVDNKLVEDLDLYSKDNETVSVDIDGIYKDTLVVYVLKSLLLFIFLFLMSYIACVFLTRRRKHSQNHIIAGYSIALAMSLVYIICFSKELNIVHVLVKSISIFGFASIVCINFINWDYLANIDRTVYKRLVFLVVILLCILIPTISIVNEKSNIKETIDNNTENIGEIHLVSGTTLKQNINVLGQSNKAYIKIKNRDGYAGTFTILAVQNQKEIEWEIQGIDCNNRDSIPLDLSELSDGEFSLYITAQNGEEGKSVEILTSDQVSFGALEENGSLLINTNLLMSVELSKQRDYYRWQIALFIVLITILVVTILFILRNKYSDKIIFALVTTAIFFVCCIRHPIYFLDPQPIYETGSNFFFQTYEKGFVKSFFVEDFMYWPLFTRLISDIIVLLFRQRRYAMLLLNVMGGMIFALNCALINLKVFRINLGKYERLLLSLILGISPLFNNKAFISLNNSTYYNFILLTLLLTVDWNRLKKHQFILAMFSTITIVSKIVFVAILPVYIAILFFLIIKRNVRTQKRLTAYLISGICMATISVVYTYNFLLRWNFFVGSKAPFGERMLTVIRQTPLYYYRTLYEPIRYIMQEQAIDPYAFLSISIVLTVLILVYICINGFIKYSKNRNIEDARDELTIILFIILSIATAGFLVYTDKDMVLALDVKDFLVKDFTFNQRNFIITVDAIIFIVMLLKYFCTSENLVIFSMLVFGCSLFLHPFELEINSTILTNWSKYYTEIYRSNYVIPILAGDMFVQKNAFAGYIGGDKGRYMGEYNYIYSAKTIKEIDSDKMVYNIDLSDVDKLKDRNILEIYARKNAVLQSSDSYVLIKDRYGNVTSKVDATFSEDRQSVGYSLPGGIKNIGSLEFYYTKDNAEYPLLPEIYLGIEGEYEE